MPELPEVETVCKGLRTRLPGRRIASAKNFRPNLRIPFPDKFADVLRGANVLTVRRRARYILIDLHCPDLSSLSNAPLSDNTPLNDTSLNNANLNDAANNTLIIHLGMSGKLTFANNKDWQKQKHDHAVFNIGNGEILVYNDTRRFGFIDICPINKIDSHQFLEKLGVEPLCDEFNADYLLKQLKNKRINIKTAMMDNRIVVGVGNIYINEALYDTGISPLRPACSLKKHEAQNLVSSIKEILANAIEAGGSSLRDYVNSQGDLGYFQNSHKIYGRENKPCLKCSDMVKRIVQNGRSTFYCQSCQS